MILEIIFKDGSTALAEVISVEKDNNKIYFTINDGSNFKQTSHLDNKQSVMVWFGGTVRVLHQEKKDDQ